MLFFLVSTYIVFDMIVLLLVPYQRETEHSIQSIAIKEYTITKWNGSVLYYHHTSEILNFVGDKILLLTETHMDHSNSPIPPLVHHCVFYVLCNF
jgi:hypothetical protein